MATDQAGPPSEEPEGERGSEPSGDTTRVAVGSYTWMEFMEEQGHGTETETLYAGGQTATGERQPLGPQDWEQVSFDPVNYLHYHPLETGERIEAAASNAKRLDQVYLDYLDLETTAVKKDEYTREHFRYEYYYESGATFPRNSDGSVREFHSSNYIDYEFDEVESTLSQAGSIGSELRDLVDERTVNVNEEFDEDEFFTTVDGHSTLVDRYDLEKAVTIPQKLHFLEVERYWVNKPYAFVMIFKSEKENEFKYYLIEPYETQIESDLQEFLTTKLRMAIKYSNDEIVEGSDEETRLTVIERETRKLLERYDLYSDVEETGESESFVDTILSLIGVGSDPEASDADAEEESDGLGDIDGLSTRPEPVLLEENSETLTEYQVEKLLYVLKRNFIGYGLIDGIKHDINVEDISCDGYNSPVFVYHSDYEQLISNVEHGETSLDDFVVKLAQRSGKGISKRQPQVDATLPDGSRAQLTLGKEVSDHGTNYTIRQFKDVPFTPIDLVNWYTFSLEEMAFLWLCIENNKSLIFAGGTASGKTTSLNAVSLFIPSNTKIVSIEDTREVELPQRNWIASVTRPSFGEDDRGDVDEFDLLEAALRQRPDYIVMGEIRGEEGRTLFQVMSTGHTTYTTFHADSVSEVLKRFTTQPINVSKTLFTALDLVSIQTQTRVDGSKVRRNRTLTEINHYDAENDEINVQDVFEWQPEMDEFVQQPASNTLDEITFDRGWSPSRLDRELKVREIVLAYLIDRGLNDYAQVAATIQAFINDQDTILTLIANDQLGESLENLREMESVFIDIDPEKEKMVPRPDPDSEMQQKVRDILAEAEDSIFQNHIGKQAKELADVLAESDSSEDVSVDPDPASEASADVSASAAPQAGATADGSQTAAPQTDVQEPVGPQLDAAEEPFDTMGATAETQTETTALETLDDSTSEESESRETALDTIDDTDSEPPEPAAQTDAASAAEPDTDQPASDATDDSPFGGSENIYTFGDDSPAEQFGGDSAGDSPFTVGEDDDPLDTVQSDPDAGSETPDADPAASPTDSEENGTPADPFTITEADLPPDPEETSTEEEAEPFDMFEGVSFTDDDDTEFSEDGASR